MTERVPLPDFLIVGAMKAGTTTLYRDLSLHPDIHMPAEKEPETLVGFDGDLARIRRDYASLFRFAPAGSVRGEASTAYTKRPLYEGVAARAREVCGPALRIIYLRRDPVKRIVSHYKHAVGLGQTDLPFDAAVRTDPLYVSISRYDWQISPWIEAFGEDAVLQLEFETYVRDRQGVTKRACAHLGVDPERLPSVDADAAFNASDYKPVARAGLARAIVESRLYQRLAKPLLPEALRERARQTLPKAEPVEVVVTDETRRLLNQSLIQQDQLDVA
ncbi:sulfotransferase family protein [Brevundimonas sp. R86498]|uniref:sulfotransferase family protein n=1 Tax=Brevundimonas sp. R86498 TaxID=3093845 RepID=UPI0037CA9D91